MQRRRALTLLSLGGVGILAGGLRWLALPKDHPELAIDAAIAQLDELDLSDLETTGAWDLGRTFEHLAQSVEFSVTGYPEARSPLFRNTVGRLAYNVFQTRGAMQHQLDAPIPGEIVAEAATADAAMARLRRALHAFRQHDGELAPHFAYGALSKPEYAAAHVMHLNNHFEEIRIG